MNDQPIKIVTHTFQLIAPQHSWWIDVGQLAVVSGLATGAIAGVWSFLLLRPSSQTKN